MKEVIIFTNTGKTYHFNNVTDIVNVSDGLRFTYIGVATGVKRTAQFSATSTCGWAISDMKEEVVSNGN